MKFGEYAPYLEISVAVNLLFGVWSVVWNRLSEFVKRIADGWLMRLKKKVDNIKKAAKVTSFAGFVIERSPDVLRWVRKAMPPTAKAVAALVVATIMLALFFIEPKTVMRQWGLGLILASPLAQPFLMAVMVILCCLLYALFVRVPYLIFRRNAMTAIEKGRLSPARLPVIAESRRSADAAEPKRRLSLSDDLGVSDESGVDVAHILKLAPGKFVALPLSNDFDIGTDDEYFATAAEAVDALATRFRRAKKP